MRPGVAVACASLALLSAGAASAKTPNIAGVWQVQGEIRYGNAFGTATPTCTFHQAGGTLSGECVGPNGRGPLQGMIAGDKVSWTWSHVATTAVGVNGVTTFNGTYVDSHLIRGAMSDPRYPVSGSFTQTR
jgi:hypothetical protein